MAGSLDWFVYRSDNGSDYTVFMDESNAEAMGFPHYQTGTPAYPPLPSGLQMRFVYCQNNTREDMKRKFYCPTIQALQNFLQTRTVTASPYPGVAPETWSVTTYRGENQRRLARRTDTGLNDGDNEG